MGYLRNELFSSIPLFANLSESDKSYLSHRIDYIFNNFEEDEIIISEGSESTHFFILIRGTAKVTRNSSPDQILSNLVPGDIFGEMSYITGNPRSANVIACSDVMAMQLSHELIQEMPSGIRDLIKDRLIQLMAQRINKMASVVAPTMSGAKPSSQNNLIHDVLRWLGI